MCPLEFKTIVGLCVPLGYKLAKMAVDARKGVGRS